MPTFVRPDGDQTVNNWTSTPLFEKIDEVTPSDTDFVQSENDPANDIMEVTLENQTDPASSTGHIVRYRYQKGQSGGGAPGTINLIIGLYQGTTLIASTTHSNIATGFVAGSFTLTGGEADNITDYNDLRVRIDADKSAGARTSWAEISWVEFETPSAAVAFTQVHFRIRDDDAPLLNANAGGDWAELEDVIWASGQVELAFRIRFSISAAAAVTDGFQIRGQKDGAGGYALIGAESDPWDQVAGGSKWEVSAIPSAQYVDLDATTQVLTASAGSFVAGDGNEDPTSGTAVFAAANDYTEMEWTIIIRKLARNLADSANVHNVDAAFWEFRLYLDDGTALDTYTNTPRITLINRPGQIGGAMVETPHRAFVKDKSGNLYYLGEYADLPATSAVAVMMKSTDGGDSWNPVGTAPASFDDLESTDMHYVEADNEIYIGAQLNTDARFYSFRVADHASADTWSATDQLVSAATPGAQSVQIHWRVDNTAVCFYHDNDGNDRIRYRIRSSGGTWGGELTVDTEASTNLGGARTVMDDADDTIHIFYHAWDATNGEIWHKSLDSSGTLSGRTQVDQGGPTINVDGGSRVGNIVGAVIWTDGATKKVGVAYHDDGGVEDIFWNESAVSSISFTSGEENALTDIDTNVQGGASVSAGVAVDDVDDVPYVFGTDLTAANAFLKYDSRVSGTWQGDTNWSTERHKMPRPMVFVHSSGNGGARVVGFIHVNKNAFTLNVGSGGTGLIRYDEIVIAAGGGLDIVKVEGETVQIAEGDIHTLGLVRQEDETIQLAEGGIRVVGLVRQEDEAVQVSEADIPVVGHIHVENETIQIPEADLHILGKIKLENETVEIAEVNIRVAGLVRQENETDQITEGDLKFLDIVRIENESVQLVEVDIRVLGIFRQDDRSVQIVEGDIPVVGLLKQEDDTVQISEDDLHILGKIKLEDESLDISEGNIRVVGLVRQEGETAQISEGDIVVRDLVRLLAEAEQISGGDIRVLGLVRLEAETEQIAEADIRVLGLVRQEG